MSQWLGNNDSTSEETLVRNSERREKKRDRRTKRREVKEDYEKDEHNKPCHKPDHHKPDCHKPDHCKEDCCRHLCTEKCCAPLSNALGTSVVSGASTIQNQIIGALDRGVTNEQITQRLPVIQAFYLQAGALVRNALVRPGKIAEECCEAYATNVQRTASGVLSVAIFNALNPLIPIGDISNPAPQPGTVVQNLRIALEQIEINIDALKQINRKCAS